MSQRSIQNNPDNRAAQWDDIRDIRNVLRESPITLDDGRTFDADKDSFILFNDAIADFAFIDPEDLDVDGKLPWKMTNNSYTPCTQQDLIAIMTELRRKRTKRAARLQKQAEIFALNPPSVKDLKNPQNWGV
jgi:hypothetical protein